MSTLPSCRLIGGLSAAISQELETADRMSSILLRLGAGGLVDVDGVASCS